jgi:hypothetical protein
MAIPPAVANDAFRRTFCSGLRKAEPLAGFFLTNKSAQMRLNS